MRTNKEKKWWTTNEVAEFNGVSRNTPHYWARLGKIESVVMNGRRFYTIDSVYKMHNLQVPDHYDNMKRYGASKLHHEFVTPSDGWGK